MKNTSLLGKLWLIGLVLFISPGWVCGQTTLKAGDIAITGVNMDEPDEMSIVFFVNIESGTEIKFADKGWKSDNTWRGFEGIQIWTASVTYTAGEEIIIQLSELSLSATGDQIIAYQNDFDMIAALNCEGDHIWQSEAIDAATSFLPQGLTNSKNCVALIETDNIIYNRNVISGTKAEILAAINDYTNWNGHNSTRQTLSSTGFTINTTASSIWSGATDTDWATTTNWTNGIPTSGHNVTIPTGLSNYPTISASNSADCYDLTLEGTATLNIISDATNSGSLIVNGTSSGNVTYQRYVTGNKWHLIASPVAGQDIGDLLVTGSNNIVLSGSNYSIKDYDENSDSWNTLFTAATTGNFSLGKGYVAKRNTDGIISFSGTLNSETLTVPLSRNNNGWTLVGNPYTSAIGVTTSAETQEYCLSTSNCGVMDDSYSALYLWVEEAGYSSNRNDYKIINNAGEGLEQHYIQAGQGFFIKAKSGGGNFQFTPDMRAHQTSIPFKSSPEIWSTIELKAEIESVSATTLIKFNSNMTKGLDISYDAGLLNSNPNLALYTRLVEDNGIDFMLQCLPTDYEELVIPIGLDANAGEIVSFSAKALNIPEAYSVILEDRLTNTFINLSEEGAKYTMHLTEMGDDVGRFFIRTAKESTLDLRGLRSNNYLVYAKPMNNQLIIRGETTTNTIVGIYSITGKQIALINLESSEENRISFNAESGIYIIQITSERGMFSQKFTWIK